MKKNLILIVVLSFFIFILIPFVPLFGPDLLRDYTHKELVYKVITSKLTNDTNSDREKSLRLFYYVHTHLFIPENEKTMDKHPLNDLVRGIGRCDQQSNTLITLARKANIKGRLIFLRGYEKISHHSVNDLYIDGKFRIFDPLYGYLFITEDNNIATFLDIQDRNIEIKSEQFDAMVFFNKDNKYFDANEYFRFYENKYKFEIFRSNFNRDLKRILISGLIDSYYDIFGDLFLVLFQEFYFKLADVDLFLKARLKHLSFRFESAISDYNEIININRNNFLESESLFFKAQAFWDMGDFNACILTLEKLLKEYPQSRWRTPIYFYLGSSYENIKNINKAKFYYSKIKGNSRTPAPTNLMKLINKN